MNTTSTCLRAAVTLLIFSATTALGQGTSADYERAKKLREMTRGKVFKTRVDAHWFGDDNQFWYRNDLAEGKRQFILVDAGKATRGGLADQLYKHLEHQQKLINQLRQAKEASAVR